MKLKSNTQTNGTCLQTPTTTVLAREQCADTLLRLHVCVFAASNNNKQLMLQLKRRTENLFYYYATMLLRWTAAWRSKDVGDHATLIPLRFVITVWTTTATT